MDSETISGSHGRPDSRCGAAAATAPAADAYGFAAAAVVTAAADVHSQPPHSLAPASVAPVGPRIRQLQQQLSKAKVASGDPTSPDFSPRGSLV